MEKSSKRINWLYDSERVFKMTIRKNDSESCPFGLKIPYSCENAGETITKMAPLETLGDKADPEEKQELALANARLLIWDNPCQRCRFAAKIFDDKNAVECNFGTNTEGAGKGLPGSAFYPKVMSDIALDGLTAVPTGYYVDETSSRNSYYGISSTVGSDKEKDLEKKAEDDKENRK
jgi:hypothetical protein